MISKKRANSKMDFHSSTGGDGGAGGSGAGGPGSGPGFGEPGSGFGEPGSDGPGGEGGSGAGGEGHGSLLESMLSHIAKSGEHSLGRITPSVQFKLPGVVRR
ncbi:MAG: hypothetical protein IPL83_04930 [Bdellovibrionales bacterium]|nr:hypothetical protein [Bdellovibrionales bacterium]